MTENTEAAEVAVADGSGKALGQAAYEMAIATGEIPNIPWEYKLPHMRRRAWKAITRAAIDAQPSDRANGDAPDPITLLRRRIADLEYERDEARAEAARLRERPAAQPGFTEHPACDGHRWYAVVKHCGSFAYGFAATSDGLRVWDDADEFEYAKARDFE